MRLSELNKLRQEHEKLRRILNVLAKKDSVHIIIIEPEFAHGELPSLSIRPFIEARMTEIEMMFDQYRITMEE